MSDSRVIFITGATDGLGKALAHRLAAEGATLIVHGRDQAKLDCTADCIRDTYGINRPRTVRAELAELAQVRRLAAEVQADTGRLDVFVSNAGIGPGNPDGRTRRTSVDGYELRFAVNYLAGFLLTSELLPLLRASAPARVVNVSSTGQYPLEFGDLMLENGYNGTRAYGQSKLAQIMSGFEFASQLPAAEVTVNSLHPATYMPTKMVLAEFGRSLDSLEEGVETTHRLVTDQALAETTGKFFDGTREARANPQTYDRDARTELLHRSLQLTEPRPNRTEAP